MIKKEKTRRISAKGKVSCEELSQLFPIDKKQVKNKSTRASVETILFVLRKWSQKICPKLGKNTCALTYSTPGSYHQTLVTKTGGKTHHLSYKKRLSTENNGTSAIQAVKESSASYHLWCGDKNGKMRAVQQIPSEWAIYSMKLWAEITPKTSTHLHVQHIISLSLK